MDRKYKESYFKTNDGLTLFARDYPAISNEPSERENEDHVPLLCLHGLTRNSRDFHELCCSLPNKFRIVSIDQRGRGQSEYDSSWENYQLAQYVEDTKAFIDNLGLRKSIVIGTSMGGLIAMLLAAQYENLFSGLVLNDIGPEIEQKGLRRIREYGGMKPEVASWAEAADYCQKVQNHAFPNYKKDQWEIFAQNVFHQNEKGEFALSYDANIMKPLLESDDNAAPVNLWAVYDASSTIPTLVVRGELSEILSRECVCRMAEGRKDFSAVEVVNVGHAPTLVEDDALAAISLFIEEHP